MDLLTSGGRCGTREMEGLDSVQRGPLFRIVKSTCRWQDMLVLLQLAMMVKMLTPLRYVLNLSISPFSHDRTPPIHTSLGSPYNTSTDCSTWIRAPLGLLCRYISLDSPSGSIHILASSCGRFFAYASHTTFSDLSLSIRLPSASRIALSFRLNPTSPASCQND